jgi:ABC-2 type transport system ATP-binding protein
VLDEPEQRLDVDGLACLAGRLEQEKRDGLAILMACHDAGLVERVADRVVHLGSEPTTG